MKLKQSVLFLFFLLCLSGCLYAQAWSGILNSSRAIDWTQAGVPGGIPTRNTVCSSLTPSNTLTDINNAIANCGSGQVVSLAAGTYNLAGGIIFNNHSNVTLRGAGPDQTFLVISADNPCGGLGGDICIINGEGNSPDNSNWGSYANWTAGYSAGTTSITLDGVTNLHVGSLLILDQCDTGLSGQPTSGSNAGCGTGTVADNGNLFVCVAMGTCSQQGATYLGRGGVRNQTQTFNVTSISGSGPYTVGITPGLYMPNWASGSSPGAWWSTSLPVVADGIESLSVDTTSEASAQASIYILNCYGCWVQNVRSINTHAKHIWFYQSSHNTVQNSYFFGTSAGASNSYGVDQQRADDNLIQNNIFQHIATPMIGESAVGSVFAYDYAVDDYYVAATTWQQASSYEHAVGNAYLLWEGNQGIALTSDDIHGTADFITAFRNYWNGRDPAGGSSGGKTQQTNAVQFEAFNRYSNLVGNVLGTSSYHTNYQVNPSSTTDPGSASTSDVSIYSLGYSGNEGTYCSSCASGGSIPNDTTLFGTLMRWGNYDTVNAAVRWVSGEVPSSLRPYGNAVPSSQTLPVSFYFSAQPSFWTTAWGTPPWPPIGPDVSGGNITNVGGHANNIPAELCYSNTPIDNNYGSNNILLFNAAKCYTNASAPAPPAVVTAAPH